MTEQNPNSQVDTRLIPWWSYVLAVAFFIGVQALLFLVLVPADPHPKPKMLILTWGILIGMFMAFYMLMIGYVTRDARRRGMNPTLWLFVMISLLPSGVGFIVYFLLRQPVKMECPQCQSAIQAGYNFCPRCQHQLHAVCEHCRRTVSTGDAFCHNCGSAVATPDRVLAMR
jgi:hypothetical protein